MTDLHARVHRGPDPRAALIRRSQKWLMTGGQIDADEAVSLIVELKDMLARSEGPIHSAPILSYDLIGISPDDAACVIRVWDAEGPKALDAHGYPAIMERLAAALRAAQETP